MATRKKTEPDLSYIAEELRPFAVPIDSLELDPKNARLHPEKNREATKASLAERGQVLPITVRLANRVVMTGNSTLELARELGWSHIAATFRDYTEQEAAAWAIAHNRSAELAEWDLEVLGETILEFPDVDWQAVGFDAADIDAFGLEYVGADGETTTVGEHERELPDGEGEDDIPETPSEPITKVGDIWIMGDHRLICGDCRDPNVVARLLDGAKINVAFTSPPYASQRKYDESSGFQPIDPNDYVEWFDAVQANVRDHLAEDGSWFVNIKEHCEDGERHLYVKDLTIAHKRRWGWRFVDEFCWRRTGFPGLYPNRFKNSFEPVFHFSTKPEIKFNPYAVAHASNRCIDSDAGKHVDRDDERSYDLTGENNTQGFALPGNVLDIAQVSVDVGHSAVFPVALPQHFIKAFSDDGDAVLDPFSGSGTTIIAAEKTGRHGYGCEISPRYCDVTVARWEKTTGKKAELLAREQ
jgi:DNA modification methylase